MKTIVRMVGVIVAAFAAAVITAVVFTMISMPFERFESQPVVHYGTHAVEGVARGFAFVFVGSLVAPRRRRAIAAFCLVAVGISAYTYGHATYAVSSQGFPVWHFSACVAGGLLASAIQARRDHETKGQQSAAPNGGPATRLGNSGVPEGPPSVS
jgi:hypothetical protein